MARASTAPHFLAGVGGVRCVLPRLTRITAVSHDAYTGSTLSYDAERGDYELVKLETVPGVREDDPLRGAKVALPPAAYEWDAAALRWVHKTTGAPYAGMARRALPSADLAADGDSASDLVGARPIARRPRGGSFGFTCVRRAPRAVPRLWTIRRAIDIFFRNSDALDAATRMFPRRRLAAAPWRRRG